MKNNNIILMGFMGVGKGSLARELVKQTSRVAIDTDDIIESMENTSIKKIFEHKGEKYFREVEKKVSLWLEESVKNTIISIGGGFFQAGNLQEIGHVIYLESSFEDIIDRIKSFDNSKNKLKKRPLLKDIKKASSLLKHRDPLYKACADTIINTAGKSSKQIAKEIIKLLKI